MTTMDIQTPGVVKITNESNEVKTFAPYKENFVTGVPAGYVLELGVKTAGQALYYLQQATEGLSVVFEADYSDAGVDDAIHFKDEVITIANSSDKAIDFIPYRENFAFTVKAGDSVQIVADSVGQVLYYLAQQTEGLAVSHEYAQA